MSNNHNKSKLMSNNHNKFKTYTNHTKEKLDMNKSHMKDKLWNMKPSKRLNMSQLLNNMLIMKPFKEPNKSQSIEPSLTTTLLNIKLNMSHKSLIPPSLNKSHNKNLMSNMSQFKRPILNTSLKPDIPPNMSTKKDKSKMLNMSQLLNKSYTNLKSNNKLKWSNPMSNINLKFNMSNHKFLMSNHKSPMSNHKKLSEDQPTLNNLKYNMSNNHKFLMFNHNNNGPINHMFLNNNSEYHNNNSESHNNNLEFLNNNLEDSHKESEFQFNTFKEPQLTKPLDYQASPKNNEKIINKL